MSVGGAFRYETGVSLIVMGFAMVRELSISTIGSRPIDSASATASGMELIGPTGIESARILVIQNSAVEVAKV